MRRAKFDPPEYRDWAPDPEVMAEFEERLTRDADRARLIGQLGSQQLLDLYAGMLRFRLFDIGLKRWVRQGVISKAWLGVGEEAVSVGCSHALREGDAIGPMIRNAGACFEMGMAMSEHFAGYLGTTESATQGRDLHVGDLSHGVIAPISHVGSLLPVMCGVALGFKKKGQGAVAMTWVGDGASRTGEIHESVNYAAVTKLPIVIVVQNNQVALGTRTQGESVAPYEDWLAGYGMPVESVDGNNVLDVWAAATLAVERCRNGQGPVGMVAHTFRMGGHATHDEAEARRLFSPEEFAYWGNRDPVGMMEEWLATAGRLDRDRGRRGRGQAVRKALKEVEDRVEAEVEAAAELAKAGRSTRVPDPSTVGEGVYAK